MFICVYLWLENSCSIVFLLKKIRPSERLESVPIVAVAAAASLEQMNKARQSGFDGFLGKPLDSD